MYLKTDTVDLLKNPTQVGLRVRNDVGLASPHEATIEQHEKVMGEEAMFCVPFLRPWIRKKRVYAM